MLEKTTLVSPSAATTQPVWPGAVGTVSSRMARGSPAAGWACLSFTHSTQRVILAAVDVQQIETLM